MTVQNASQQSLFSNQSSQDNGWQMIDGQCVRILSDDKGQYFVKGGTEKVYLSEYYEQKDREARKARVQDEISQFFSNQEGDFAQWRDYYASKISLWTAKAAENKVVYQNCQQVAQQKEAELRPLYDKYNTFDVSHFAEGKDKDLGMRLLTDKRHAKSEGNIAFGQMQTENWIAESYRRLMNHSEFCRTMVTKIAEMCFNS